MDISYHPGLIHHGRSLAWRAGGGVLGQRGFGAVGCAGGDGRSGGGVAGLLLLGACGDDRLLRDVAASVVLGMTLALYFARRLGLERVSYAVWSCARRRGG